MIDNPWEIKKSCMTKAVYSLLLFCGLYELDCEGLFHLNTKYSYYNKKCIYGNLFVNSNS